MPGLRGRTGAVAGWHKRAGRPPALWPRTPAARAPARAPPAADKGSGRTRRRGGHGDAHQNPVGTQETRSMPAARVGQRLGYIAIISGVVAPHPDVQFAHHPHARAAQLAASGSRPGQNAAHRRTKKSSAPSLPSLRGRGRSPPGRGRRLRALAGNSPPAGRRSSRRPGCRCSVAASASAARPTAPPFSISPRHASQAAPCAGRSSADSACAGGSVAGLGKGAAPRPVDRTAAAGGFCRVRRPLCGRCRGGRREKVRRGNEPAG